MYKLKIFLVQLLLCHLSNSEEDINKNDCFMVLNSKKDLLIISEDKGDGTVEIHYPLVNKTFIANISFVKCHTRCQEKKVSKNHAKPRPQVLETMLQCAN